MQNVGSQVSSEVGSESDPVNVLVGTLLEQVERACFQFRRDFKAFSVDNVAVKQGMRGEGSRDSAISDSRTGEAVVVRGSDGSDRTDFNDVRTKVAAHTEPTTGSSCATVELAMRTPHEQHRHTVSTVWDKKVARRRRGNETEAVPAQPALVRAETVETPENANAGEVRVGIASYHPRVVWDVVGMGFILYDLVMIPMRAFSPPETNISAVLDWTIMIFWTLNTIASFFMSYTHRGMIITEPRQVAKHYLKTWFVIDLVVLVPDWYINTSKLLEEQGESADAAGGAVRFLRIFRLAKCLRILRAAKLTKLSQALTDRIESESTTVIIHIFKMFSALLIVNHYVASFWFIAGTLGGENSWIEKYKYNSVDWVSQYVVCFHWGITQFTPSSKPGVLPVSMIERVYAILVVIAALLGFSYILGSITSSLTQLRALSEDEDRRFFEVRRYLRRFRISKRLGTRILRFLEFEYARVKKLNDGTKVQLFAYLSDELRSELRSEILIPILKIHPLFALFGKDFTRTLRRIVPHIERKSLAVGETLFFPWEEGTHMHFLELGELRYQSSMGSAEDGEPIYVRGNEAWISEAVLWTSTWIHLGHMSAKMASQIVMVGPKEFAEAVSLSPAACEAVASYARNFVQWVNLQPPEFLTDVFFAESHSLMLEELVHSSFSTLETSPRKPGDDRGRASL